MYQVAGDVAVTQCSEWQTLYWEKSRGSGKAEAKHFAPNPSFWRGCMYSRL